MVTERKKKVMLLKIQAPSENLNIFDKEKTKICELYLKL
jgi:hypothetical protein